MDKPSSSVLNGVTVVALLASLLTQYVGQLSIQSTPCCEDVNTAYKDVTGYTALACGADCAFAANVVAPWNTTTTCIGDVHDADFPYLFAAYFATALLFVWELARGLNSHLRKMVAGPVDNAVVPYGSGYKEADRAHDVTYDFLGLSGHVTALVIVILAYAQVAADKTGKSTSECFTEHDKNEACYAWSAALYAIAVIIQFVDMGTNRVAFGVDKTDSRVTRRPDMLRAPTNLSSLVKALSGFGVLVVSAVVADGQLAPVQRCLNDSMSLPLCNLLITVSLATVLFSWQGLEKVKEHAADPEVKGSVADPLLNRLEPFTALNQAYFPMAAVAFFHTIYLMHEGNHTGLDGCQADSPGASKDYVPAVLVQVVICLVLVVFGIFGVFKKFGIDAGPLNKTGNVAAIKAPASYARPRTSADMQTLRLTHDGPDKKASSLSFV
jgi:hypothetical protein